MSIRNLRCAAVFAALVCLPSFQGGGLRAQTLLESHFGITLSVSEQTDHSDILGGDYTRYVFDNTWAPTPASADYALDDYTDYWSETDASVGDGTVIAGGEIYDVEALFFDDDAENLYMSIVTSFAPPPGYYEDRITGSTPLVVTGDLALNLGLNGPASANDPFNYDYAVNLNNEVRQSPGDATANGTPALGGALYRTANSDWYTGTPNYAVDTPKDELTNFDPFFDGGRGTDTGTNAVVAYTLISFHNDVLENNHETYVIDVTIPRSGLPTLYVGDEVEFQYVMGCRNDGGSEVGVVRLSGVVNVPEPGSSVLVLLAGCAALSRRSRNASSPANLVSPPDSQPQK